MASQQSYPLHAGRVWTYSVSIVDLLHFPLALPGVGQQGDGTIRAPTGQDQTIVMGGPAYRVYYRKEGGTVNRLFFQTYQLINFSKKKKMQGSLGGSCNFVN